MVNMPAPKGQLTANRPLADLTWMRVGGRADYFFLPESKEDLSDFIKNLCYHINVFPMGVGSNVIVRDGGVRAVVIRLGSAFNHIEILGNQIRVGAAVLDAHLAKQAAQAGLDLTFLRTIPGAVGGAVKMNAGCYGTCVADVLDTVEVVLRSGASKTLPAKDLNLRYRGSDLPAGCVITAATFRAKAGDPKDLAERMQDQLLRRDQSQPKKLRSAGSTFRNPVGFSSTGQPDDDHSLKAWKVIDEAGLRGARIGGAQISPQHANFMINTGDASAKDLEDLGEMVRKKVFQTSGIQLEWEIMRVGDHQPD